MPRAKASPLVTATVALGLENLTLTDVVDRLAADSRVVGVVLFGSASEATFGPASDYDLAVVVRVPEVALNGVFTTVEGRLCDIVFVDADDVEKSVATQRLPTGDYWQQGLRRWVVEGRILFERDGLLSRFCALSQPESWFSSPTSAELHAMWYAGYYRLWQLKRHLSDGRDVTDMYVDLRFGLFIFQAVRFYFAVRDHPWTGIRRALAWAKESDPGFFNLVRRCLDERDRYARWRACVELFDEVMRPVGGWPPQASALAFKQNAPMTEETVSRAVNIVRELFGCPKQYRGIRDGCV